MLHQIPQPFGDGHSIFRRAPRSRAGLNPHRRALIREPRRFARRSARRFRRNLWINREEQLLRDIARLIPKPNRLAADFHPWLSRSGNRRDRK